MFVNLKTRTRIGVFTLKYDKKTCDSDFDSMMIAKNVEKPPLNTAGPIDFSVATILSFLSPSLDVNGKSNYLDIMQNAQCESCNLTLCTYITEVRGSS